MLSEILACMDCESIGSFKHESYTIGYWNGYSTVKLKLKSS